MIILRSIVTVVDRRPVIRVRCIGGGKNSKIGAAFPRVVRQVMPGNDWKQGQKVKRLLVRTRAIILLRRGTQLSFFENRVILVTIKIKRLNPISLRVKGPFPRNLRSKGYSKLFALGARPL